MATEKVPGWVGRPRARFSLGFLAALTLVLPACVQGHDQQITSAYNPRLRPDRAGLTEAQTSQALNVGTYSTHGQPDQLVSEIYPVMPNVEKLPVSGCVWIGAGSQGRDMLRLHWEAVGYMDPQGDIGQLVMGGDHDLGMCRINDPVDRTPPHGVDSVSNDFWELSITETLSDPPVITASASENWPRHTTDLVILAGRLVEWTAPALEFGQCPPSASLSAPVPITGSSGGARGVSFFNGPSDPNGLVSLCTPKEGYEVSPDRDGVRYQVFAQPDPSQPPDPTRHDPHWLSGTVMVVDGTRTIARLTSLAHPHPGRSWSTPNVTGGAGLRWEENFTSSLRVDSVRLFRLVGAQPVYETTGASLCLDDPHDGQAACRWECQGMPHPDGGTVFPLLGAGAQCRTTGGAVEVPHVTPTYVVSNLGGDALSQPLSWRVDHLAINLWIEFKLASVFTPAALTAEPALTDLGSARRTSLRQGTLVVRNVGSHPMRIDSVSLLPGWGSPGDFSLTLPAEPQPIPIPLDFTPDGNGGFGVRKGADWSELEHLVDIREGSGHTSYKPASRDGYRFSYQGESLTMRGGLAFLDNPAARLRAGLPAGVIRPLQTMAYVRRAVPFELLSGESFPVLVSARPQALGDRLAMVRIDARSLLDGSTSWIQPQVKVYGLQGPLADVEPTSLSFPLLSYSDERRWTRSLMVSNNGDQSLTVNEIAVDAGPFPTPGSFAITSGNQAGFALASGGSELVEVQHWPFCQPNGLTTAAQAVLTVKTSVGNRSVPLVGSPSTCIP